MSQKLDAFLQAFIEERQHEVNRILEEAFTKVEEIKKGNKERINDLKSEFKSFEASKIWLEPLRRDLENRWLDWVRRVNMEKGRLIDQMLDEIRQEIKRILKSPKIYEIITKLFEEAKLAIGSSKDYEIHISKTLDAETFKRKAKITDHPVISSLEQVGIVIKQLDAPISVTNTLESRMEQGMSELRIFIAQTLWSDLQENPWSIDEVMMRLEKEKSNEVSLKAVLEQEG